VAVEREFGGIAEELQGYSEALFTALILNGYFVQKSAALVTGFSFGQWQRQRDFGRIRGNPK